MNLPNRDHECTAGESEEHARIIRRFKEALARPPISLEAMHLQVIESALLKLIKDGRMEFSRIDERGITDTISGSRPGDEA